MPNSEKVRHAGPFQRIDQRIARIEGAVAVAVLLAMVFVASLQAVFFNIAERDIAWARAALDAFSWADMFLQKGTLWLAFVGASLATHYDRHIAIDVVAKFARPAVSRGLRLFASLGAGVLSFVLAYVFYQACLVADSQVPLDYEVLTPEGRSHVCDAPAAALGDTERPALFCALRSALGALGIPVTSGGGAAQLIVPLMFLVIGVRLLARAWFLLVAPEAAGLRAAPETARDDDPAGRAEDAGREKADPPKDAPDPDAEGNDQKPEPNAEKPEPDAEGNAEKPAPDAEGNAEKEDR